MPATLHLIVAMAGSQGEGSGKGGDGGETAAAELWDLGTRKEGWEKIMVGKKQFSQDASTVFPPFTAVLLLSLIPPFLLIRFTFLILLS